MTEDHGFTRFVHDMGRRAGLLVLIDDQGFGELLCTGLNEEQAATALHNLGCVMLAEIEEREAQARRN